MEYTQNKNIAILAQMTILSFQTDIGKCYLT